jgi:hypothetical protein
MSDLKRYADRVDQRAADLKNQLAWYRLISFRLRGHRGDGSWTDETDAHVGRVRKALRTYQAIRAKLRREHKV